MKNSTVFLRGPSTIKILLIEDNQDDAYIIKRLLNNSEVSNLLNVKGECYHTSSLASGIEATRQQSFNAILTDLGLPDFRGSNILDRFHHEKVNLPIIVLTGLENERFAIETVRNGAQDYLTKTNLSARILLRTLCFAIERFRLKDRLKAAMREIQTLQGFLPICAKCKNVKDNEGYWKQVEQYISERTDLRFSHGYCPECYAEEMATIEDEFGSEGCKKE